ncbi:MAG TPA: hypothetical protein VK730_13745 [Solirubrobacteraceae bacterium]|jgi:hypothetical protein|nr:hypothetical protein [Solirubrobacteraceae bacterium]
MPVLQDTPTNGCLRAAPTPSGLKRTITLPAVIRKGLYEDTLLDLGGFAEDLSNLCDSIYSPKHAIELAGAIGNFDSFRRVLDALDWKPDGGEIEVEVTDDLRDAMHNNLRHEIQSVEGAQEDLDKVPTELSRKRHLHKKQAILVQVKEVCEQIAFPTVVLDAQQREHLHDYLTRRYVMEGESMERQETTVAEVNTTGTRLAVLAALVELAEGVRKSLAGIDLDSLDWLLAALEKETAEVLDDDRDQIEKVKTGNADYRVEGMSVEDMLAQCEGILAKDEGGLAFVRWMREQVKEAR